MRKIYWHWKAEEKGHKDNPADLPFSNEITAFQSYGRAPHQSELQYQGHFCGALLWVRWEVNIEK